MAAVVPPKVWVISVGEAGRAPDLGQLLLAARSTASRWLRDRAVVMVA